MCQLQLLHYDHRAKPLKRRAAYNKRKELTLLIRSRALGRSSCGRLLRCPRAAGFASVASKFIVTARQHACGFAAAAVLCRCVDALQDELCSTPEGLQAEQNSICNATSSCSSKHCCCMIQSKVCVSCNAFSRYSTS
jgi:hypothetical protein